MRADNREMEMDHASHERQKTGPALRALMTAAAALCVLGLAGLVFVHAPDATVSAREVVSVAPVTARDTAPANASTTRFAATSAENFTNVPSAESVFRGKTNIPPEEPIDQF
jgi:hypothetical protein